MSDPKDLRQSIFESVYRMATEHLLRGYVNSNPMNLHLAQGMAKKLIEEAYGEVETLLAERLYDTTLSVKKLLGVRQDIPRD